MEVMLAPGKEVESTVGYRSYSSAWDGTNKHGSSKENWTLLNVLGCLSPEFCQHALGINLKKAGFWVLNVRVDIGPVMLQCRGWIWENRRVFFERDSIWRERDALECKSTEQVGEQLVRNLRVWGHGVGTGYSWGWLDISSSATQLVGPTQWREVSKVIYSSPFHSTAGRSQRYLVHHGLSHVP